MLTFCFSGFWEPLKIWRLKVTRENILLFNKAEDTHWLLWTNSHIGYVLTLHFLDANWIGLHVIKEDAQGAFMLHTWEYLFFCLVLDLLFWNIIHSGPDLLVTHFVASFTVQCPWGFGMIVYVDGSGEATSGKVRPLTQPVLQFSPWSNFFSLFFYLYY